MFPGSFSFLGPPAPSIFLGWRAAATDFEPPVRVCRRSPRVTDSFRPGKYVRKPGKNGPFPSLSSSAAALKERQSCVGAAFR